MRVGKVFVSALLIDDAKNGNISPGLKVFIEQMVIVRCERIWDGTYEYIAFSPLFDEIEQGQCVPKYKIIITRESDVYTIKAEREV